jgi:hypothetical protein
MEDSKTKIVYTAPAVPLHDMLDAADITMHAKFKTSDRVPPANKDQDLLVECLPGQGDTSGRRFAIAWYDGSWWVQAGAGQERVKLATPPDYWMSLAGIPSRIQKGYRSSYQCISSISAQ